MISDLFKIFSNPNDPNFWSALTLLVTILLAFGSFLGWLISKILNNSITKTSRILIRTSVELYLDWVKVSSQSQIVNDESIRICISENGGSIQTGRTYLVFKKFIEELKKQGHKNIILPDEEQYNLWVQKYEAIPKWSRSEW
tara:strand:- start:4171 stop:4596 length:426 start_codon:yes stop_codon:yes gene_type:complete